MTDMKHTPGPWRLELRHNCQAIVDANGQDLAYQDTHPRFLNGEACGSVTSRGRTKEELKANARLIAAAPELLAALEECKTSNNANCIVTNDVAYMIRRFKAINAIVDAAIAKATGSIDAEAHP